MVSTSVAKPDLTGNRAKYAFKMHRFKAATIRDIRFERRTFDTVSYSPWFNTLKARF